MMIAASLFLFCSVAVAQQSKSDETLEFRPHWTLGVQAGMGYTLGEYNYGQLISPAAQLSFGYQFHHAMGVRVAFAGWQAKSGLYTSDGFQGYSFPFLQLSADYMLDLCNLFGGFKHDRLVNPYAFVGVGALYGFNNLEAAPYQDRLGNYWEGGKFFVPVRFGVGVDFRLSDVVSIGIEGNTYLLSDKFNSKVGPDDNLDWQFNLLVGVKIAFGGNTRPSKAYAEKVAAEEEAARLAAEKAAAERAAAEKAAREAAERAEAERLAAEKAAKEAAERAAAERAALAAANSDNVFFTIGSTVIRKAEDAKLVKLAEWMKANPDFTVSVIGYGDKGTGTAKVNDKISAKRAQVVKERLEKLGIDGSRIIASHKGDTVQPFAENDKNRVVICTLE